MAASYPATTKNFGAAHVNTTDVVDASHVNALQEEVVAIETALGINPFNSSAGGGTYTAGVVTYGSVAARLANIENGITADVHTHYVKKVGGDTIQASGTGVIPLVLQAASGASVDIQQWKITGTGTPLATLSQTGAFNAVAGIFDNGTRVWSSTNANLASSVTAETSGFGLSSAVGTSTAYARADHAHGNPALSFGLAAAINNITTGAASAGTSASVARIDHIHPAVTAIAGASAVGDTAAIGTSGSLAMSDHRHSREGFGAVTSEGTYGISAANGSATTLARSDHTHGTPALTANTPAASAVGDTAAVGTGTTPARDDHRHAREAFGSVTTQTSYGASSGNGSATTVARSDHTHGTVSLTAVTPSTSAVGDTAAVGTGTASAREDHKHAREAFGNVTSTTSFGLSSANGTATTLARADHSHGTPAWVGYGSPAAETFGAAGADGTATTVARSDHVHAMPTVSTTKTIRIPHTFVFAGTVGTPSAGNNYIPPFFISLPSGQTATIAAARHRIRGGTSATWTVSHGTVDAGTSVTGLTTIASSTTVTTSTASGANTLSDGDAIQLTVTAVSGSPDNLTVTVFLDVTV